MLVLGKWVVHFFFPSCPCSFEFSQLKLRGRFLGSRINDTFIREKNPTRQKERKTSVCRSDSRQFSVFFSFFLPAVGTFLLFFFAFHLTIIRFRICSMRQQLAYCVKISVVCYLPRGCFSLTFPLQDLKKFYVWFEGYVNVFEVLKHDSGWISYYVTILHTFWKHFVDKFCMKVHIAYSRANTRICLNIRGE